MDFEAWRRDNPDKPFHQFYVDVISAEIAEGRAHGTCGAKLKRGKVFGKAAKGTLKLLIAEGMQPHHTCVDYGCGSLRIGVHVLKYLEPGHFWGLDVTDTFFEQGKALLGEAVVEQKRPNLRVISPESVSEVAREKPDFIFSEAVAVHVPAAELPAYFSNLVAMTAPNTTTLVKVRVAETCVQYKRFSWAYPRETFCSVVEEAGGYVDFQPCDANSEEGEERGMHKCWLKISVRD